MARFRNVFTGSTVTVADEKADRFTSGWEPVVDETSAKKPAAKSASKPAAKPAAKKS